MEKPKYYTPEITEFHVGFEYEYEDIIESGASDYFKATIKEGKEIDELFKCLYEHGNNIRVKYLDKQDIIDLGFESQYCPDCYNDDELKDGFALSISEKEDIYLHLHTGQNVGIAKSIMYNEHSGNWYDVKLFKGKIKNKSELKRLLTQIGVL